MTWDDEDFYTCPNHTLTHGWEECCECGGWGEGEEQRMCTEFIEYMRELKETK